MNEAHRSPSVLRAGEGFTTTLDDIKITYKVTSADTNGAWALVEYSVPPYAQGSSEHWHNTTAEALYVLDGLLGLTLDDQTITVNRGAMINIPPGVRHTFFNPTASTVTLLAWLCPGGCEGFLSDIGALRAAAGAKAGPFALPQEQLEALWRKYDHYDVPLTP